jgi:hypothetical protein
MSKSPPPTCRRWAAWHLAATGWELLAEADTATDCFKALLQTVPAGNDWSIVPSGEHPEQAKGLRLRRGLRDAVRQKISQ